METDIARLVLAYLKKERLDRAAHIFCKTSPFLHLERDAYKPNFVGHSFLVELKEIISDWVKITHKVDQVLFALPDDLRNKLQNRKISNKVIGVLDRALQTVLAAQQQQQPQSATNTLASSRADAAGPSGSVQSDKENNTKRRLRCARKRKRESLVYSSNDEHKRCRLSGSVNRYKKRSVLEPFGFLSAKRPNSQLKVDAKGNTSTTGEEDELATQTEDDDDNDYETVEEESGDDYIMEKPTKQSTPRNKNATDAFLTPSMPEISEAILHNPEFQMKLVQNINHALNNSTSASTVNLLDSAVITNTVINATAECEKPTTSAAAASATAIDEPQSISQLLLDKMIQGIMEKTEKDPIFNEIIQEVVEGTNKSLVSAAVQCNIAEDLEAESTAAIVAQHSVVHSTETLPTVSYSTELLNIPSSGNAVPPSTPLIIRKAVAAAVTAAAASAAGNDAQMFNTLTAANMSYSSSIMDPNYSISKLIVVNSNDSAQKQQPELTIGNITADNIISQLGSSCGGGAETSTHSILDDQQVYFDAATGQLTFPIYLTNDGLLTTFPFLINNDIVTQQLLPENMANLDASRIEIPLAEPIIVSADQLPPNSIIIGSTQKAASNAAEERQQPRTVSKTHTDAVASCSGVVVPSSLDSRHLFERTTTPAASGIVNSKAYKSLSTPRKRASHVRHLTFSPRASMAPLKAGATTPLSTRKATLRRFQRIGKRLNEAAVAEAAEEQVENEKRELLLASDKPIIKNVEILPRLAAAASIDMSANESSNSCNVPPLFAASGYGEESSNQTVIRGGGEDVENCAIEIVSNKPAVKRVADKAKKMLPASVVETVTPKRIQVRRKAVRACKRRLSKSSNDDQAEARDPTGAVSTGAEATAKSEIAKENINVGKVDGDRTQKNETVKAKELMQQKDQMLEKWQRMRNATNSDLDSRLRELNAKMRKVNPTKKESKKIVVRRKKTSSAVAKKKQKAASKQKATNTSTETVAEDEGEEEALDDEIAAENVEHPVEWKLKESTRIKAQSKAPKEKRSAQKLKEFNIKIPTPHKTSEKPNKEKYAEVKEYSDQIKLTTGENEAQENRSDISLNAFAESMFQMPPSAQPSHPNLNDDVEREKRTANIACLLETPFKDPSISTISGVPPTPGIFAPSMETPQSKLKTTDEEIHSHSFLFGSMTKSEYAACDTPMLSAKTPGYRFTPFTAALLAGGKDAMTPRSNATTECSSGGGSYYKPDESEDLDRNIDKMLRDSSAQKKRVQEEGVGGADVETKKSQFVIISTDSHTTPTKQSEEICVEIPVEKLRVEPIVLKRIKSFGTEAVDSLETATVRSIQIDPHYTLASGLPSLSAAEEEDTSSSASSSSSSSSSSNKSATSSSTSSSSSSAATISSTHSKTVVSSKHNTSDSKSLQKALLSTLSLEDLSDISSTEDEDWKKLVHTEGEDSQLVGHDGEVRYPVRSWLTPSKEQMMPPASSSTIKVTLPLMSAEKRNRQRSPLPSVSELELKRERVKEKLKLGKTEKLLSTRNLPTIREKPKKQPILSPTTRTPAKLQLDAPVAVENKPKEENRTIEVLTALHLSAKKPSTEAPITSKLGSSMPETIASTTSAHKRILAPRLGDSDDNAVSNIFVNAAAIATQQVPALLLPKVESVVSLKPLFSNVKTAAQRKCLQIDALPATSRLSTKQKKIVRTPLGFKGGPAAPAAASESVVDLETVVQTISSTGGSLNIAASSQIDATKTKVKTTVVATKPVGAASSIVGVVRVSPRVTKGTKAPKTTAKTKPMTGKKVAVPRLTKKQKLEAQKKIDAMKIAEEEEDEKETQLPAIEMPAPPEPAVQIKQPKSNENKKSKKQKEIKKPLPSPETVQPSIQEDEPNPSPFPSQPYKPPSEINDAISEEDEPLEGCELTSITEADPKQFISVVYNGPDDEPKELPPKHDFSTFKMVVAIDENEKYTWQVTDEICLFAAAPIVKTSTPAATTTTKMIQPIRNIPKKRKIRIATISEDSNLTQKQQEPRTIAQYDNVASVALTLEPFVDLMPAATSTPLVPRATTTSDNSSQKTTVQIIKSKSNLKSPLAPVKTKKESPEMVTSDKIPSSAAEKIHIEDIESILSHLHGT